MPVSAKVVADSINPFGNRLTTMEITLHRFVLPEFNTHRLFSRNFQSSRAIPFERQLKMIEMDMACPVYWGKNQSGMQAYEELSKDDILIATDYWYQAFLHAKAQAKMLHARGVHKQIVNRLLEPFMFTKGVVTGTNAAYNNFFTLRCHEAAQPEIQMLAKSMHHVYNDSTPIELFDGEWHMPYVNTDRTPNGDQVFRYEKNPHDTNGYYTLKEALKVSSSCCAQVSYRKLDDSLEKSEKVYGMLNLENIGQGEFERDMSGEIDPAHASPCEHQAMVETCLEPFTSNFNDGWDQYRQLLTYDKDRVY